MAMVTPRRMLAHGPVLHSPASAAHCWKRAHNGQHETFSPACVRGQKRGRILAFLKPVF